MVFRGHLKKSTEHYPGVSEEGADFHIFDVFWWESDECKVDGKRTLAERLALSHKLSSAGGIFKQISLFGPATTQKMKSIPIALQQMALHYLVPSDDWEGLVFRGATDMFTLKVKLKTM